MTYLRLIREPTEGGATLGSLYLNDAWQCWTLEDVIREPIWSPASDLDAWVHSWKLAGRTAIPQGRYQVGLTLSARFGVVLPELLEVPGFSGIRIHAGNTDSDTSGCILVGRSRGEHKVVESRAALAWLQQHLKVTEAIVIDIENPRGLHLTEDQLS